MAGNKVFDNVTNWSTYQDRQLSVLTSLEKSFTISLSMSRVIKDNLYSMQSAMTSMIQSANSLTNYVNNLTSSRAGGGKKSSNARAAREAADLMRRNLEEIHKIEMQNQQDIYETTMDSLEEQLKASREELEETRRRQKTQREMEESQREFQSYINHEAMKLMSTLGKMADNYLSSSNNLIKITGSSGALVQETRNTIVNDIISTLNKETGGVYSPQDSYQKMVGVASEAGIGSTEALKEMTRPLLLADESMDANLGDIAKLFHRFYTRYSFSSIEMENIVDEIRGNTAGNAATAQATMNNIASLESWISLNARGDTAKMEDMMESISQYTSWLESMNIDSSRYTKDLESIAWGDAYQDPRMIMLLNSVGSSVAEAQALLTEGQWDKVTELIALAEKNMYEQYASGSQIPGPVLDALQQDRKSIDTYNALTSKNATTLEEFLNTVEDAPSAVETVEDQFVSLQKRANNFLEQISNGVANIQNALGISLTDVVAGVGIFAAAKKGFQLYNKAKGASGGASSSLFGSLGSTGPGGMGPTTAGTGLVGGLSKAGTALGYTGTSAAGSAVAGAAGIAGGVIGSAALVSGISDLVKADSEATWQKQKDLQTEGALKLGGTAAAAVIGTMIAPGIGTLIGAGVGGLATLIWGDDWAESITNALDGTAKIQDSMKALEESKESIDKAMKDSKNFEKLEKAYREQKKELDVLVPGTDAYESQLEAVKKAVNNLNEAFPGYIEFEEDELTVKESSIEATKQMIEAEKALARIRSQGAVEQAIESADDARKQIEKSGSKVEEYDKQVKAWNELEKLYQDVKKYESEFELDEATGEILKIKKGASKEATEAYSAYKDKAWSLYKEAGLNTVWDNVDWTLTKGQNADRIYGNMTNKYYDVPGKVEKLLTDYDTAKSDSDSKRASYERLYTDAVNTLELSIGGSFEEVAKNYSSLTATEQSYFSSALSQLSKLNSEYTDISSEVKKDPAYYGKLAGLPGYAIGTNYISRDQIAYLHEGEAVVPKAYNPAANRNELEVLREQAQRDREQQMSESNESSEYIKLSYEVLNDIKEFLAYWKDEKSKQETINNAKSKYSAANRYLAGYTL